MAFQLDRAGGAEVLKIIVSEEVGALASQVSAAAGPDSVIETKTSGTRFVATVKVPAAAQAKDGVLSRAAAKVGLDIKPYPNRPAPKANKPGRKRGRPRKSK